MRHALKLLVGLLPFATWAGSVSVTRFESSALAAASGGGVVSIEYGGIRVRRPDGREVRWVRSQDGYRAILDGRNAYLSRRHDGFVGTGCNIRRISERPDGFVVLQADGTTVRWNQRYGGYAAYENGQSLRIRQDEAHLTEDDLRYLNFIHGRSNTVKRMKNSRPSAFRVWRP